jgi:hypothetical protein
VLIFVPKISQDGDSVAAVLEIVLPLLLTSYANIAAAVTRAIDVDCSR